MPRNGGLLRSHSQVLHLARKPSGILVEYPWEIFDTTHVGRQTVVLQLRLYGGGRHHFRKNGSQFVDDRLRGSGAREQDVPGLFRKLWETLLLEGRNVGNEVVAILGGDSKQPQIRRV